MQTGQLAALGAQYGLPATLVQDAALKRQQGNGDWVLLRLMAACGLPEQPARDLLREIDDLVGWR